MFFIIIIYLFTDLFTFWLKRFYKTEIKITIGSMFYHSNYKKRKKKRGKKRMNIFGEQYKTIIYIRNSI